MLNNVQYFNDISWIIEQCETLKIQNTLHTKTCKKLQNGMDILQTFMAFLQNFIFQEFHILQNRCILMQLCFKNYDAWNICLIEFLHQSVQIIAPCFEIGKHASAHQYVQTMAKYHYNVVSSLFAYISYKVFELLITSFIKCNTLQNCNYRFKILQCCWN